VPDVLPCGVAIIWTPDGRSKPLEGVIWKTISKVIVWRGKKTPLLNSSQSLRISDMIGMQKFQRKNFEFVRAVCQE
jgi:hypothetical protein